MHYHKSHGWLLSVILFLAGPSVSALAQSFRSITGVEPVNVEVSLGCVPRLPFQLWVDYSDGTGEYRQVKWLNASQASESAQSNEELNPVGTRYRVRGQIIGDNTTPAGFPVSAEVMVTAQAEPVPSHIPVAEPLPLDQVSLDGDNRLTWNRNLDIDKLISLPVRQQLFNYRDTYGLPTDGYPESDGWDSPSTKLKGHGSGHYMSALAFAYASCTDKARRALLKSRIAEMVDGLRECQERTFIWNDSLGRYWEARDFAPEAELQAMQGSWEDFDRYKRDCRAYGYGYLNAIPAQHLVLIEMYRAYNNEKWVWAPYYAVHKQLAGLVDIATYIDDRAIARKALLIAKDMGLWVWNRMHYRTFVQTTGSPDERRARPGNRYEMWNMYIAGEVGGMAEVLARLSELTGEAEEKARLLEAATYFDSPAFFDPLARNIDAARSRHANQHIPMVTGALRIFRGNADPYYYRLARNFWTMIQGRYRYATGGVGNGEMFRQPYSQITSMCTNVIHGRNNEVRSEPILNETCCAYNLAKLTRDLNCFDPDDARLMDYYERVMYNQIVGSLNPLRYETTYQYAVGLDASKPWGNETPQSSCCGGTGMENHVKYQEAAYYVSDSALWVALYLPTTARWQSKGIVLRQECSWPAEQTSIRVVKGGATFAMKLRVPYWATAGFDVRLNGRSIAANPRPCSYLEIPARRWRKGDVVEVSMPFTAHLDFGPDKMETAPASRPGGKTEFSPMWAGALMYGPLVMAATGISDWDEATLSLHGDLSDISLMGPGDVATGPDARLYSLRCAGRTFLPDYAGSEHLTHYFRLNIAAGPDAVSRFDQHETDLSQLRELVQIAKLRADEQAAWQAMDKKVPEYAPWAPHAFARMMDAYRQALPLLDSDSSRLTQPQVDRAASLLNAIINAMRPGNLPEPEDLAPLLPLLERGRQHQAGDERILRAVGYAEMVVRYVSDGSGTHDMIVRAVRQLSEVLEP